jgi:hypothetical protein
MPIRLEIHAESVTEFNELIARFAGNTMTAAAAIMPEIAATPAAQEAVAATDKPVTRGRGKKTEAAAPTQAPDGTPIEPVHTPEPQPTPGGTDAPPAESIPPKQEGVDPFAQNGGSADAAASPSTSTSTQETVAAAPAASSPADTAAAAAGEVTMQQLKDAMSDLLKAKSAGVAMKTLEESSGCKSLTSGSPSVAEKAKDDPTIMRKVLDALVAAKTA